MAKVLICGGRNFDDKALMAETCYQFIYPGDTLIHGDAPGADRLAAKCAGNQYQMAQFMAGDKAKWTITIEPYPAEWLKYGHRAGPIRNQQMIDEGKPDLVVAMAGGRGTNDMVQRAEKAGIKVVKVSREKNYMVVKNGSHISKYKLPE